MTSNVRTTGMFLIAMLATSVAECEGEHDWLNINSPLHQLTPTDKLMGAFASITYLREAPRTYKQYTLDDSLSNDEAKVYVNLHSHHVIIAFRGSVTKCDWLVTDVQILFAKQENAGRFMRSKALVHEVDAKYSGYTIDLTGHSLAGSIVMNITSDPDFPIRRGYSFNPGLSPLDKKIDEQLENPKNRIIFKLGDIVSNTVMAKVAKIANGVMVVDYNQHLNPIKNHLPQQFCTEEFREDMDRWWKEEEELQKEIAARLREERRREDAARKAYITPLAPF